MSLKTVLIKISEKPWAAGFYGLGNMTDSHDFDTLCCIGVA